MGEVGKTVVELTVGKPYNEERMEVEDEEYNDEAAVWGDPCNNGVGEIEGNKVKDDGVEEDDNDGNDDDISFAVVAAGAATVVAVAMDDKDCKFT